MVHRAWLLVYHIASPPTLHLTLLNNCNFIEKPYSLLHGVYQSLRWVVWCYDPRSFHRTNLYPPQGTVALNGAGFDGPATVTSSASSYRDLMHINTGGKVRPPDHVTPQTRRPQPYQLVFPPCVDGPDLGWRMEGQDGLRGFGLILKPSVKPWRSLATHFTPHCPGVSIQARGPSLQFRPATPEPEGTRHNFHR